ncbi:hypothetical protein PHLH7_25820 [Pseudomonas sp. Ost2]|uniref:hypothetical protein n=1 Tax=Pseudomonas sp. Ost2 TaxID=2678260 RepID=UPI001BB3C37E|nr:hypothetical protein [Pseudomonas sp. Ost2]BBP76478.1 hypothetical protein PHLH7_25820 [Pseudomonas sp. Ost2]
MISNHLSLVEQHRQSADAISAQVAQFVAAGGRIAQLKSPPPKVMPPERSTKIDPSTVLKRKPRALTRAERQTLRQMADSL